MYICRVHTGNYLQIPLFSNYNIHPIQSAQMGQKYNYFNTKILFSDFSMNFSRALLLSLFLLQIMLKPTKKCFFGNTGIKKQTI